MRRSATTAATRRSGATRRRASIPERRSAARMAARSATRPSFGEASPMHDRAGGEGRGVSNGRLQTRRSQGWREARLASAEVGRMPTGAARFESPLPQPPATLWRRALVPGLLIGATAAHATPEAEVAAHTWSEVRAPHVTVVSDANRDVAQRVAQQLEDLRQVLALAAPALVVDAAPVQIILFRDPTLFANYAPVWRGLRDPVAGFFQTAPDVRRVLLEDDPARLQAIAQHEYTHALLDAAMPEAPL